MEPGLYDPQALQAAVFPKDRAAPPESKPVPDDVLVGIYFLIADEAVVYVGQSVNIRVRADSHRREAKRLGTKLDRVQYLEYPAEELAYWETLWICHYRPHRNYLASERTHLLTPLGRIYFGIAQRVAEELRQIGPAGITELIDQDAYPFLIAHVPVLADRAATP